VAGGYFKRGAFAQALQAVDRIAKALDTTHVVELPEAARARAASPTVLHLHDGSGLQYL